MRNEDSKHIALLERFGFMPRKLLREEISDIIKENGWEQRTFAKMCGLSETTISKTLSGSMLISKKIAERYAEVLDLDREETVRRAFVESTCQDMAQKYHEYPSIVKLIKAIQDFSTVSMIYEE